MKQITLIILLVPILCHAQIKTFDIPTPNAAELCRYGDVPVSYYTGKADISIPLYSLTVRDVTLPISLNYNASGVLVNCLPGWLGDNWSLSAGGVISRIVQDVCDEYVGHESEDDYNSDIERIYYEHDHYVKHNYFRSYQKLPQIANFTPSASNQALKDSIYFRDCDFSADIFYFNFLGKTGRFFLGNDGQWKVFCDENLEVIFDYNDTSNYDYPLFENYPYTGVDFKQPKTIKGFVIRDGNGTEYHFGGNKNFIEYSLPFFRQSSNEFRRYWTANSWYLNKIVDRHGNILFQFEYQRGKYIAQLYNAASKFHYYYRYDSSGYHTHGSVDQPEGNYVCPFDGVLNAPIYLTGITTFDKKSVSFTSSDANMSMTDIYASMYSKFTNLAEWYTTFTYLAWNKADLQQLGYYPFYYLQTDDTEAATYQHDPSSTLKRDNPLLATRLRKLDGITLYCTANSLTPIGARYTFEYSTTGRMQLTRINMKDNFGSNKGIYQLSYYTGLSADYISTATDHWGYYNASPVTQYPVDESGYSSFAAQRQANSSVAKAGMLSEIIYPTGGKTEFDYESHDYGCYMNNYRNAMVNTAGIAGGVRIRQIKNYDTSGDVLSTRTFTYTKLNDNTKSSGQLYAQPQYYWGLWESDNIDTNARSVLSLFKSSSIIPLSNKFGPHVGYSCVRETYGDGSYNVYTFSNLSDSFDSPASVSLSNNTQTPYDVFTERDYKRGHIQSHYVYSSTGALMKKTDYTYRTDNVEGNYVWTSSLRFDNFISNPYDTFYAPYSHFTGGIYKLFYPKYDIVSQTTTTYNQNQNMVQNNSFNRVDYTKQVSFGNYTHHVDIRMLMSETMTRGTTSVTTNYTYPFYSGNNVITQGLFNNQFFLQPIYMETTLSGQIFSRHKTEYASFNGLILPERNIEYKGSEPDTLVTYIAYTNTGSVSRYREQGKPVTILGWGWNDNYLLSKAEGSLLTQYTYDPLTLNLTRITQPNGNYETYSYDSMGRLYEIRNRNGNLKKKYTYNYQNK